ncbi:MAG: hypothetical protein KKH34_03750 [Candidatus Omnitrophica bacterium]|nr:hypothetical protein [Candidatus Omnitrophota bacterium]
MKRTCLTIALAIGLIAVGFAGLATTGYAEEDSRDVFFAAKGLPYGFDAALPEIHGFLSSQFWNVGRHVQGYYADGTSAANASGESTFLPQSFYVDIIAEITPTVLVEGEFELYHGSSVKPCAQRVLWHPSMQFNLSIGRQFVMLGSQEKVYYPTSTYRFFTWQPYLYERFLRFTGWWDAGICAAGRYWLMEDSDMFLEYGLMISNGPGDLGSNTQYTSSGSTYTQLMNSSGYVYEQFNSARQSYDNNDDKALSWRLGFSPFEGLLWRIEAMTGKYDTNDKYDFTYLTSELFYTTGRLDSMIGLLQLDFDAPADTGSRSVKWPGGTVTQQTYYISAGYKVLDKEMGINFVQPVIRYQWCNPNVDAPSSVSQYEGYGKRSSFDLGVNFSPWEHVLFRAAYRWQDIIKGPAGLDGDGFTMEAVVDF